MQSTMQTVITTVLDFPSDSVLVNYYSGLGTEKMFLMQLQSDDGQGWNRGSVEADGGWLGILLLWPDHVVLL